MVSPPGCRWSRMSHACRTYLAVPDAYMRLADVSRSPTTAASSSSTATCSPRKYPPAPSRASSTHRTNTANLSATIARARQASRPPISPQVRSHRRRHTHRLTSANRRPVPRGPTSRREPPPGQDLRRLRALGVPLGTCATSVQLFGCTDRKIFQVMGLSHPAIDTRDIALFLPFRRSLRVRPNVQVPLVTLVNSFMGRNIGLHGDVAVCRRFADQVY